LIAERVDSDATAGFMQSFCRDDSGSTLMGSVVGSRAVRRLGGIDGGNEGRRSSDMNWLSWECVRDVKKI